jgi:hypothetical protein
VDVPYAHDAVRIGRAHWGPLVFAPGPLDHVADASAFLGTFRTARAKGTFAGIGLGYAFKTRGAAAAELGSERNGVFLS